MKRPVLQCVVEPLRDLSFVEARLGLAAIACWLAAPQAFGGVFPPRAPRAIPVPRHTRFVLAQYASDLRQRKSIHVIARQNQAFALVQPGKRIAERAA